MTPKTLDADFLDMLADAHEQAAKEIGKNQAPMASDHFWQSAAASVNMAMAFRTMAVNARNPKPVRQATDG